MITTTGVQAGSYTAADITVNEAGQITSAASNSVVVSGGGGGPKITGVAVTDNVWTALDDTAVDVLGGYIKITGSGFSSGCLVYFNQTPASSVSFISSTELRVTTGALSAGTYVVYAINTDGGVAISVPGVTFSATPGWQTASTLSDQYDGVAITLSLIASDATSYTLVSGSLPPGLSLNASTGAITGTVVGVTVDTSYTFTVRATDAQNQDSPRTFTVTITVSDPYFNRTTLLLSGSALTTNTVLRDSSTNNFNLTAYGDARASNFTPYGTGWSLYTNDRSYLTIPASSDFDVINTDFTIEFWINFEAFNTMASSGNNIAGPGLSNYASSWFVNFGGSGTTVTTLNYTVMTSLSVGTSNSFTVSLNFNTWYHVAFVRSGSGPGNFKLYINGIQQGAAQNQVTYSGAGSTMAIGSGSFIQNSTYSGNSSYFLSNFRLTKSAVYLENFTPATTPLTALENTTLLLFNQSRLINAGTNTGTITSSGYTSTRAKLISFNPFGITNTGVNGSMYFDGTTDSVRLPSNAISALPGDFTLEFWIYLISTTGNPVIYLVNATAALIIYVVSSKVVVRTFGTADLLTSVDNIQINTWTHVAVARSGSALSLWLNGSRASGGTVTYSTAFPQGEIRIATNELDAQSTNGYIADLRLIKGTAQYNPSNTAITVPTAPLTAVANTQLLTLQYDQPHNNHALLDASSNQHLITRNGNATQGSFSPFSQTGWGNYFKTGTDAITSASSSGFAFGTGNYTIEAQIYWSGSSSEFQITGSSSNNFNLYINATTIGFYDGTSGITRTTTISKNTWLYIALVRSGGSLTFYLNGSAVGSTTASSTNYSAFQLIAGRNTTAGTSWADGYISNLRISNLARTISSTPTSAYTQDANTVFLLGNTNRFLDQGVNGLALTITGTPSVVAFSPFNPTAVYNPATHGASAYFDGTGDYVTVADNPAFNFGNGDFTMECWVYPTASGSLFSKRANNATYAPFSAGFDSSMIPSIYCSTNGTTWGVNLVSSIAGRFNSWNHIAYTRLGSTFTIWVNGISGGTSTAIGTSSLMTNSTAVAIAATAADGNSPMTGYLTGVRFIKGTALYTTAFTPPTAPLTATTNTSILLNFTDAAILDSTGRQVFETVADAKSSGVVTKFTGGSISFDGTGDALRFIQSPYWNITSTTTHTIEAWVYHTGTTAKTICSNYWYQDGSSEYGWMFQILNTSSVLRFASAAASSVVASTTAVPTGVWAHVAATIVNLNVTFYINGVNAGGGGTVSSINYTNTIPSVGAAYSNGGFNSGPFVGYINDLRITQGHARYTANFTPPTAPHRLK
jgi:hypothetical protein